MTLRDTLEQVPGDRQIILKPKGSGTHPLMDTAAAWLADDGVLHNLDDFELVSEIHLPDWNGHRGTLAELMAKKLEPLRFVIDGLIPEGLSMLAGKPKLGKSWLALGVSLAICAGDEALGHSTDAAEILYVALEDGERRLQDRVRTLGGDSLDEDALARFHYRTEWGTFDKEGLDQLSEWMNEHPRTRLIVIDTYGKVRGNLDGKDRYAEEYELLGKIQTFATAHRVAIILIHHLRKQAADDWLEQLSGTQAITGAADTLLGLFRERGQMDATLRIVSREIDEKDLALRFDGGRWIPLGDALLYRQSTERTQVLEILEDMEEGSASDIATVIGKSPANASYLLRSLFKEGLVREVKRGVYALSPSLTNPLETQDSLDSTLPNQVNQANQGGECNKDGREDDTDEKPDPW